MRRTFHSTSNALTSFDNHTNCKFTISSLFLKYFIQELNMGILWENFCMYLKLRK